MFRLASAWYASFAFALAVPAVSQLYADTFSYYLTDDESESSVEEPSDPFVNDDIVDIEGQNEVIDTEFNCNRCTPRNWIHGDYLLWWTKGNDLPALVTTGTTVGRGVLGSAGTQTLFGEGQIDDAVRSGLRVTAGHWLDDCQESGIELTYFSVFDDTGTGDYFAQTTGGANSGTPVIARPFSNVNPAVLAEDSVLVSYPNTITPLLGTDGSIRISSSSEMHSASALLRHLYKRGSRGRLDVIGGYRYFRYREGLLFEMDLVSTATGSTIVPGTTFDSFDQFVAENDFHGGDFGMVAEFWHDRLTIELLAKVALGNLHREVTISGSETRTVPGGGSATSAGGMLALPTNIGRRSANDFAALPEFGMNLKYEATDHVSLTFGYSLVMLNDVARTGEQIDRVVNSSQFSGGALNGAARPMSLFSNETDFWAQGISIGLVWEG